MGFSSFKKIWHRDCQEGLVSVSATSYPSGLLEAGMLPASSIVSP
jgi:hypothetical protein